MADLKLNSFDAWLWSLEGEQVAQFKLRDLHIAAAEAGIAFPQVTALTVISDGAHPAEALAAGVDGIESVRQADQVCLFLARTASRHYVVAAWPAAENVYHLIGSVPVTSSEWERVETSWLIATAPRLSPVILNRPDFEAIGDALAEHGAIETARMTARILRDSSSYTRGWPQIPGIRRPTHTEALREASEMLVRTLTLDVEGATRVHLRRTSGASYYRGDFRLFVDIVLRRLTSAASERRALLAGRDRQPKQPVREILSMSLDGVSLGDPRARDNVVRALTGVRGIQVAVMHENPYFHVVGTDFLNGSSFDVLVTDDGHVGIVPGLRSSVGSLARITDALGEALGMRDLALCEVRQLLSDDELFD